MGHTTQAISSIGCLNMVKRTISKAAKSRIKRMSASEKKAILKAATLLADAELISMNRWNAVEKHIHKCR